MPGLFLRSSGKMCAELGVRERTDREARDVQCLSTIALRGQQGGDAQVIAVYYLQALPVHL
jgi:hypothetical protein